MSDQARYGDSNGMTTLASRRIGVPTKTRARSRRRTDATAKPDALATVFAHWIVQHGLPAPECEVEGLVPGRKFRVDFLFRQARVVVEVDGGVFARGNSGHSSPSGILRDMEKANLLQVNGFRVLRYTPSQLFSFETVQQLQQAVKG